MQNCVLRMPAYRQISSFIWRSNHMLYSSAVSMHLAADLHFCGRHMGGNHFNNIRCLILHLTFRKNCCIIFRRIHNDAASGGYRFQAILPLLTGGAVPLGDGNAVLIQHIMQRFLEDRIVYCLLFALDIEGPWEI